MPCFKSEKKLKSSIKGYISLDTIKIKKINFFANFYYILITYKKMKNTILIINFFNYEFIYLNFSICKKINYQYSIYFLLIINET